MLKSLLVFLKMIKIEHSIFALPFAYTGAFLSSNGSPTLLKLVIFTIAMVAIRTFAMTANRILDLPFDKANPRTQNRALVSGELKLSLAWLYLSIAALIFVVACWFLSNKCFLLSFPTLAIAAGYSYSKRFTWLCHFILGSVLGLAPIAAWLAFANSIDTTAILLFWGVLFWVAGFDILYALQDSDFDAKNGLNSVPAKFGTDIALIISKFSHANTSIFFLIAGYSANLSLIWYGFWAVITACLILEHSLIKPNELSRINAAFFTVNGWISVIFFVGILLSLPQ